MHRSVEGHFLDLLSGKIGLFLLSETVYAQYNILKVLYPKARGSGQFFFSLDTFKINVFSDTCIMVSVSSKISFCQKTPFFFLLELRAEKEKSNFENLCHAREIFSFFCFLHRTKKKKGKSVSLLHF